MWLTSSSIGRKLVMAISGACLVLFLTFHVLMNSVALIWPTAYNSICAFLGANWYALIASAGLGLIFVAHIIYALWLTIQNRRARGTDRYAVTSRPPQVEWSSKNMLVLGFVVIAFLVLHLVQFWAKMQLAEICGCEAEYNGQPVNPAAGTMFLQMAFSQWWTAVAYIIAFVALWFHMTHGFWSMFQSAGWNNAVWMNRLKKIGCWWTSIVVGLFIIQAVWFTVQASQKVYETCPALLEQYEALGKECKTDCKDACKTDCKDVCKCECCDQCNDQCNGQCKCDCEGECKGECKESCKCECCGQCSNAQTLVVEETTVVVAEAPEAPAPEEKK